MLSLMTPTMRVGLAFLGCAMLFAGGCKPIYGDCGNGLCESTENCSSCRSDCGSCTGACGDRVCGVGETCTTCPADCGTCARCGDAACNPAASESCTTCPVDCGACGSCGDHTCQAGESCMNCPSDCGTCGGCGDGVCQGTDTCATCPRDCGTCHTALPYQQCAYDTDCQVARDRCISVIHGGVSRAFCGVPGCRTDTDCDNDMYGSPGLCVSFDGGADFNCFHRCNTSGDCYSGFSCSPTDGAAATMVCLPGASASVPPYRLCGTSADCSSGLICEMFTVGAATTHLCSLTGCATDNDCPFDMRGGRGACLNFGGTRACWERCNVRGDCANTTQFDCTTQVGSFTSPVNVCVVR